jgi:hypothetical protein
MRILAVTRHQLRTATCRAAYLASTSGLQLNIVNKHPQWNLRQRQRVPYHCINISASLNHTANFQLRRRQYVTLLTIYIVQQRYIRRTVRIILYRRYLGRYPNLVSLEIYYTILTLYGDSWAGRKRRSWQSF